MQPDEQVDVGVIGVGSMGEHHARIYDKLPGANLVGVCDVDHAQARAVAETYETSAMNREELLLSVDAASVAVPTRHHFDVALECLDAGVAPLVEKPLVADLEEGRRLKERAEEVGLPVQVGHVERFNPAVQILEDILEDMSIIGITSQRLGPPPDRSIDDSAVLDLMIHDIDIVLSLLNEEPTEVKSVGVFDNKHASSLLEFPSGTMASLAASRLTQRKVRTLEITAEEGVIELDYLSQSIEIHRQSVPEYVADDGSVRFTHESVVERPQVPSEEPLWNQLSSFLGTVDSGTPPEVTIEDGLTALEIVQMIEVESRDDKSVVEWGAAHE